ncbi:4-hydroxybenzoate octaprenyltransferase [Motiliproteus coralliicola]|uniref:4-hydroxybenzoate octaprenyltransferase n=1 Tax=Motiliproteus coralliicola TaxID=2283196 RepID=A0A369WCN3_9GAMM|nr:4-hydroxybenzoate octaprenyltransferase [Motiliproteus coralliicola]RDE18366.1 4-hydroxybenzoate octaprenyltransferase [Motiliproteus coralliicola]
MTLSDSLLSPEKLLGYSQLMRLEKPIGIYLLLWPTLWALWVAAEGIPDVKLLIIFCLGVVLMRSAGCVINDYADRNLDGHVERTRNRPLPAGRVTEREALGLFGVLCLLAFVLVLFTDTQTVLLSFGGVLLAAIYPFMKRYTHFPQLVLGAAFSWAVIMAFSAQSGEVPRQAWLIYVINLLWTVAYDTMYAMTDREDDLKIGIKSTAVLFGDADKLIVGVLQLLVLFGLLLLGDLMGLGLAFYAGVAACAGLFGYQQYLIRDRAPQACFVAFLNNHWAGSLIFLGLFIDYLI